VTIPINHLRFGSAEGRKGSMQSSYCKVRMFTGDHLDTAIAVAKKCNIISDGDWNGDEDKLK